jgi:predicted acetyltransferase
MSHRAEKTAPVNPDDVVLDVASPADAALMSNLLELYIHDLSEAFPAVELGPDGRFGYRNLPLYWSEPERRFPFIIRCGGRVAGFVLATRGSPATDDPTVLDIAEFFVLRRYRRRGVGRRAVTLLWRRLPGQWVVRVSDGNRSAMPFWTSVISEFSDGAATQFKRPGDPNAWQVFSFESPPSPNSPA